MTWLKNGLAPISPLPKSGEVASSYRIGQVPIVSKFIVRLRIRRADRAIRKFEEMVATRKAKLLARVKDVIKDAERTDSHKIITDARSLEDKLDKVCPKVRRRPREFDEIEKKVTSPAAEPLEPPEPPPELTLQEKCERAVLVAVGRSRGPDEQGRIFAETRGRGVRPEHQLIIDACVRDGGKVTIPKELSFTKAEIRIDNVDDVVMEDGSVRL